MKYYQYIDEIFKIYGKIDNKNIEYIENKFEYICNSIEKCVKNSDLEDDFRYFTINWTIIEDYYNSTKKNIEEQNLTLSYSVDDEDNIEEAFVYIVNYIYHFLSLFEYYEIAYIYRLKLKKYIKYEYM
jgi:hypothetical protein